MPADSKTERSKAPSFYEAAGQMPGSKPDAAAGASASGGDSAGEETKIIATLLEVFDKWDKLTKDPKRKEKIQQLSSIVKEIQSGAAGGATPPSSSSEGAAPGGAGGAGAGAGAGATAGQPVPA